MRISIKSVEDIQILTLSGPMMGGPETVAFHEQIKKMIEKKSTKFVVDLGKVKWLNSSGLGVLMASFGSVCRVNGEMKLVNVTQKVRSLLIVTQIITFFQTFENVIDAVESFRQSG